MSLVIFKYSRKRPFKRRQYHARIEDAHNGEPMWRTTEGYNNRADRDHAIDVLGIDAQVIDLDTFTPISGIDSSYDALPKGLRR